MDLRKFKINNFINKGIIMSIGYYEGKLYCGVLKGKSDTVGKIYPPDEIDPVILSDKWFVKFGFIKLDNKYILDDFIILEDGDVYRFMGYMKKEIRYVHELQNIYESFVDKELYEL